MIVRTKEEVKDIIIQILDETAISMYLESEDAKIDDLSKAIEEFLEVDVLYQLLTKSDTLSLEEVDLLTKKLISFIVCNCEAMGDATFGGMKEICNESFWRRIHSDCLSTSYEHFFSFENGVPKVVIKESDNEEPFRIYGFGDIADFVQALIQDINQEMINTPEENNEIEILAYNGKDPDDISQNHLRRYYMSINLEERIDILKEVVDGIIESSKIKNFEIVEKKRAAQKQKVQQPVPVVEESEDDDYEEEFVEDDEGFVSV